MVRIREMGHRGVIDGHVPDDRARLLVEAVKGCLHV